MKLPIRPGVELRALHVRPRWFFEGCTVAVGVSLFAGNTWHEVVNVWVEVDLPGPVADVLDRVLP